MDAKKKLEEKAKDDGALNKEAKTKLANAIAEVLKEYGCKGKFHFELREFRCDAYNFDPYTNSEHCCYAAGGYFTVENPKGAWGW